MPAEYLRFLKIRPFTSQTDSRCLAFAVQDVKRRLGRRFEGQELVCRSRGNTDGERRGKTVAGRQPGKVALANSSVPLEAVACVLSLGDFGKQAADATLELAYPGSQGAGLGDLSAAQAPRPSWLALCSD